jgi:hypothetical protein
MQMNFLQETTIDLGGGTAPSFVDIDKDGDDDLFLASHGESTATLNSHDMLAYYKNTGTLMNPVFELQDSNFLNLSTKNYSGLRPCFGDLNGDGKKDLLIGEANGVLKYYINTSVGSNISFVENTTQLASFQTNNYTAPYLVDFNRDGKLDLFVGNYDGTVQYYQNTGTTTAPVFTKTVDSVGKICLRAVDDQRNFYQDGYSVPVVADLDTDGKFDLLVGGKFGLYIYHNIEGKLSDSLTLVDTVVRFGLTQLCVKKLTGLYCTPAIAQLDSDSVYPDIMVGNIGGGVTLFSTYEYQSKIGISSKALHWNQLTILPNPASNTITIEGFDNENYSVLVYDATGKQIISEDSHKSRKPILDISVLQQGVYFVTLTSPNGQTYNGKFVKM